MPLAQLLTSEQLAVRLQQPNLRILDCRFALDDPAYGQRSFSEGHIPGASFADLEKDLSGPVRPGITGRHPLPMPEQFIARLRAWGVNNDSEIVLYDDGPGAFAARAWWLLLWLGKRENVFLLDGGLKSWNEAGLELTTALPERSAGTFAGQPDPSLVVEATQLQQSLGNPELTLLDARALPRFLGQMEPIDPVAGHIPGACCATFNDNIGPDGRFLKPEKLRERFDGLLQGRPAVQAISYCGSGVTACHNLFAMGLAGFPLARLYPGSWSEWITDPYRPID